MTILPANLARVPTGMASQVMLSNITRGNIALLRVQQQLSTGRSLLSPSDDIVKAATVGVLDDRLELSAQRQRNLTHASASLGELDSALSEANDLALEAKTIASNQLGFTASPSERAGQAIVVDQLIQSLFNTANRKGVAGHLFGGSVTNSQPFISFRGGYRYVGDGPGLTTDLGLASSTPITLGAGNPIAAVSSRVQGSVDLNPSLTQETRIAEVRGARGVGVELGPVSFSISGGPAVTLDLTGADTLQDVATQLEAAIRQYETDNGVTVLGPGGVGLAGGSLSLDVVAGAPGPTVEFFEVGTATTARDLGLTAETPFQFSSAATSGIDLQPTLTWNAPVSSLAGMTGALGSLRIRNAGQEAQIDLSGASTLQDIRNAIEGAGLGVRVRINNAGTGIDIVNDLSTTSANALSIEEVAGGGQTATRLGIRTFAPETRISDFNFGRGVSIVDGATDPQGNIDFQVTLGDPAQTVITIDLRPQDMATVQTVLDRINSEAAGQLAAAGLPTTAFQARLSDGANGIQLVQDPAFTEAIKVDARNNSAAADQLGLLSGSYDATSATYAGQDRAKVRTNSLFTHLMDLREALLTNNAPGIALAGESLEHAVTALAETRGLVGSFAQRVESSLVREQDRAVLDETIRSALRDTDFAEAATRFSLLQTQLEAGLRAAATTSSLSLLDFLG